MHNAALLTFRGSGLKTVEGAIAADHDVALGVHEEMDALVIGDRNSHFVSGLSGGAPQAKGDTSRVAAVFGIIGAVMGLIHVMGNLADPSMLGSGIAVAFVATIYGVASANLILLPIANKLKAIVMRQSRYREMLLEGLLSIAEGENPRSIELKLQGFMD